MSIRKVARRGRQWGLVRSDERNVVSNNAVRTGENAVARQNAYTRHCRAKLVAGSPWVATQRARNATATDEIVNEALHIITTIVPFGPCTNGCGHARVAAD